MSTTLPRRYEVELTVFDERASRETWITGDAETVIAKLAQTDTDCCVIFIAWLSQGVDRGNFRLWRRHGRALVRLDEHREHYTTQADRMLSGKSLFVDEDGTTFEVDSGETVDVEAGLDALRHWLRTGEKTPVLAWN